MADEQHSVESSLDLNVGDSDEINLDDFFEEKAPQAGAPNLTDDGEIILDDSIDTGDDGDDNDDQGDDDQNNNNDDQDENDGDDTKPEEGAYKPGNLISELNDEYELGLNLENLPEDLDEKGELKVVAQILEREKSKNKAQIEAMSSYDQLIQSDAETQQYLKDRAAGMTMKDMIAKYGGSASYSNEDAQVVKSLKDTLGLDDTQAASAIEQMKEAGTYDARKKQIVDHNIKVEQALADKAEQDRVQATIDEQKAWDSEVKAVKKALDETEGYGEFKFDNKIRKNLLKHVTFIDKEGLTQLDRDVQSTEGSIKAAFALNYWDLFADTLKKSGVNLGKADV